MVGSAGAAAAENQGSWTTSSMIHKWRKNAWAQFQNFGFSGAKSEDIWRCFATEKLIKVENRLTAPQVRSLSRSHHEYTPQRMAQLGTSAPIWVKLAFSLATKALPTKCPWPKESWSSDFSYILRPIVTDWTTVDFQALAEPPSRTEIGPQQCSGRNRSSLRSWPSVAEWLW